MKQNGTFSYRTLFFLLPVFYFFVYGRYGLDDIDGGYALSSSYRIINGEVPYRDFILVRPPLFLYLHALPLLIIPPSFQLISSRLIVYLTFALTSWVSTEIINHHFHLAQYKINKYLLSCITFVYSVHNFPPMAWHTTDGILLGVTGIYFLSVNTGMRRIFWGMFFLLAAALIKQSFYPLPFAGLLFLLIVHSRRNFLTALASLFFMVTALYLFAIYNHLLKSFLYWTTGSLHTTDAVQAGFRSYINIRIFKIPLECVVLFFVIKWILKKAFKISTENGWLILLYVVSIFLTILFRIRFDEPIHFQNGYPQILFLSTAIYSLVILVKNGKEEKTVVLIFLLALAWCSSISWGYRTPLLFAAPFIFGLIWISRDGLHFSKIKLLSQSLLIGGLICFYLANGNAYYDSPRKDLVYDMGTVFPKLSCIKSDRETFEKYSEIKELVKQYGSNFKTLPSVLLANYLTDTKSPLGVDWALDVEVNGHIDSLVSELNRSNCFAFVEKNPVLKIDSRWSSGITHYVIENWNRVSESRYFYVYHKS